MVLEVVEGHFGFRGPGDLFVLSMEEVTGVVLELNPQIKCL